MSQHFSIRHSFSLLACLLFITVTGCGTRTTGFLTPVYRIPPGYSETYRKAASETGGFQIVSQSESLTTNASHGPYFSSDDNATFEMKNMDSRNQPSPSDARTYSLFETSNSNSKTQKSGTEKSSR